MLEADLFVFDFDGTLVDSNAIKRRAFESCFSEFPGAREEILAYCWGNNHVIRSDKFRHVFERILRLPYTPEVEERFHRQFERETTQAIIQSPEIPGASEFLEQVRRKAKTAVLSSTPHPILLKILQGRDWTRYFDLPRGAPVDKSEWLRRQQENGIAADRILFFGDNVEDAQAAESAGCPFIAVGKAPLAGSRLVITDFRVLLS